MRATVELGRWPIDEEHGASALLPSRPGIARLSSDCSMLLAMVDSLEHRHESRCADNARMLAERLHVKLATHLDEEAEILRAIAPGTGELPEEAVEEAWAEHVALRELAMPVIYHLSAIARDALPTQTGCFVITATALCEFIRLHVKYKRRTLYPLLSALEESRRRGFGAYE